MRVLEGKLVDNGTRVGIVAVSALKIPPPDTDFTDNSKKSSFIMELLMYRDFI